MAMLKATIISTKLRDMTIFHRTIASQVVYGSASKYKVSTLHRTFKEFTYDSSGLLKHALNNGVRMRFCSSSVVNVACKQNRQKLIVFPTYNKIGRGQKSFSTAIKSSAAQVCRKHIRPAVEGGMHKRWLNEFVPKSYNSFDHSASHP